MNILNLVERVLSQSEQNIFTSADIKNLTSERFGINPNSVLPADYCYNRTNYGIDKSGMLENKFLIRNSDRTYTYVGFSFEYDGFVYQKPRGDKMEIVVGYWKNGYYYPISLAGNDAEDLSNHTYIEGATKKIIVNSYERNHKARQQCIEHYGCKCWVCQFDFDDTYGELGRDFIHVHHVVPLSEIGQGYEVNPTQDLLPLCPNCHAMVHRQVPAMDPQDLKLLLAKKNRQQTVEL